MSALWDEACRLYAQPGVRALCLDLQDRCGLDVPLLLTIVWAWQRGRPVDAERFADLSAATAAWQAEVVTNLRHARRALRDEAVGGPRLGVAPARRLALKLEIQAVELAAERAQLEALARLVEGLPQAAPRPTLAEVLRTCFGSVGPADCWRPLVDAATGHRQDISTTP